MSKQTSYGLQENELLEADEIRQLQFQGNMAFFMDKPWTHYMVNLDIPWLTIASGWLVCGTTNRPCSTRTHFHGQQWYHGLWNILAVESRLNLLNWIEFESENDFALNKWYLCFSCFFSQYWEHVFNNICFYRLLTEPLNSLTACILAF